MKWDPLEREQNQPKRLDSLLDSLLYKLSGSSTQEITIIIDKWDSIVGEKFSHLTHPTHIKNNKLYLQTNDAAIAQELEGVPQFQKFVSFTAYTEGWGLYTEELAKDMGFYQDPYSDFGRLAMELWRACRLVVDTGVHAKRWSREKAIQYLMDNTPNPDEDARKAIERYIAMPGQATAYMIGKLKIMALRQQLSDALGDKFDIKGFHDEILKDGPVPMSLLEEKLNKWAEQQKSS